MRTGKAPALQFYPGDWLHDVELQMCSSSTRGIWINALCHMWWSKTRGEISGPRENIIRILNCTEAEFDTFLAENEMSLFCHACCESDGIVTLRNRRMFSASKRKEVSRLSSQRYRDKQKSDAKSDTEIIPPSSTSSSLDVSNDTSLSRDQSKKPPPPYQEIIEDLNKRAGTKFDHKAKTTREHIRARWKEGMGLKEFKAVNWVKCRQWAGDAKMSAFLRPLTLYNTKMEGYLQEAYREKGTIKAPENKPAQANVSMEKGKCQDCGQPSEKLVDGTCPSCWKKIQANREQNVERLQGLLKSVGASTAEEDEAKRKRLLDQAAKLKGEHDGEAGAHSTGNGNDPEGDSEGEASPPGPDRNDE